MIVTKEVTVTFDPKETETLSKVFEIARYRLALPAFDLDLTKNELKDVKRLVNEFFIQAY